MFEVKLFELEEEKISQITRVVCVSKFNGKWVFCKHKQRSTWEIPGGHVESGENYIQAVKREMFEETGATNVEITPICLYKISTYGLLCFVEIKQLTNLPNFEMEKVAFFDNLPNELTYPESHTLFFETVVNKINNL